MQVNSVSNGYSVNFGALSSQLHEDMWKAVQRNCKNVKDINNSKLYKDYKYILKHTAGDGFKFGWSDLGLDEYRYRRKVIQAMPSDWNREHWCYPESLDVTELYWNSKDPYKEIIKAFAKFLKEKFPYYPEKLNNS